MMCLPWKIFAPLGAAAPGPGPRADERAGTPFSKHLYVFVFVFYISWGAYGPWEVVPRIAHEISNRICENHVWGFLAARDMAIAIFGRPSCSLDRSLARSLARSPLVRSLAPWSSLARPLARPPLYKVSPKKIHPLYYMDIPIVAITHS